MSLTTTSSLAGSQGLAADARSLNALKFGAGDQSPAAVKEAAKQFESLFMRELLKSMREATMKSGLMEGEGADLGTDLLDQQFAVQMSGLKGGLSDMIAQQLSKQIGGGAGDAAPKKPVVSGWQGAAPALPATAQSTTSQSGFVQRHHEVAARIEEASGIPASFMMGQAGHETGWGKKEIKHADGSPSFNLFGIKATGGWTGKVATITTTEYINGEPRKMQAKFRAYDSYEDSFRDYARMINESPRYAQARERTDSAVAYASELKKAGYATDPAYASKLSRAINSTLQLQRALTA